MNTPFPIQPYNSKIGTGSNAPNTHSYQPNPSSRSNTLKPLDEYHHAVLTRVNVFLPGIIFPLSVFNYFTCEYYPKKNPFYLLHLKHFIPKQTGVNQYDQTFMSVKWFVYRDRATPVVEQAGYVNEMQAGKNVMPMHWSQFLAIFDMSFPEEIVSSPLLSTPKIIDDEALNNFIKMKKPELYNQTAFPLKPVPKTVPGVSEQSKAISKPKAAPKTTPQNKKETPKETPNKKETPKTSKRKKTKADEMLEEIPLQSVHSVQSGQEVDQLIAVATESEESGEEEA